MPAHFVPTAAAALAVASAPAPHVVEEADPDAAYLPAHGNQVRAARAIMDIFRGGDCHYAMLIAEMQSGKTGTFQTLIRMALNAGLVDRVYILCGSAEVLLFKQARADTDRYNGAAFAGGRIKVLFRQHLKDARIDRRRALLIVDESHLDSGAGQQMMRFLGRNGLSLAGTTDDMLASETYICSVSATPYAELSKLHSGASLPKGKVVLEPGTGYFGLSAYKTAGKLKATFDIAAEPDRFTALLTAPTTPKWILFRATAASATTVSRLARAAGLGVVHYNSRRKDIAIDDEDASKPSLNAAPARTTVVILKGCLRVGKVVPKQHVAFVWENTKGAKMDTLAQALPGRMCGYFAPGADKPDIYVTGRILEERRSVIRRPALALPLPAGGLLRPADLDPRRGVSEVDRHCALAAGREVVPRTGTHMTGGAVAAAPADRAGRMVTQCLPIRLNFRADDDEWSPVRDAEGTETPRALLLDKLRARLQVDPSWFRFSAAQQQEILKYCNLQSTCTDADVTTLAATDVNLRHLRATGPGSSQSQANYFKSIADAWVRHDTCPENVAGSPRLTFCIVHASPHGAGVTPGHVYAIFYTYATPKLTAIHTESRLSTTRADTLYDGAGAAAAAAPRADASRADTPAAVSTATEGATLISIPRSAHISPNDLYDHLDWLLARQHQFPDSITPHVSAFPLLRAAYNFVDRTHNDLETLLRELGTTHGVRFTVTYKDALRSDNFGVESIRWALL